MFEKVRDMIAEQLQMDAASITPESRLVEDLKADSANVMVMILELESNFGIEVDQNFEIDFQLFAKVVNRLKEKSLSLTGLSAQSS